MRKKELKRRVEELEAAEYAANLRDAERIRKLQKLGAYSITGKTAYVSSPEPYEGVAAVVNKMIDGDPSPTHLTITSQYIPPGVDGEPGYFATIGTTSI